MTALLSVIDRATGWLQMGAHALDLAIRLYVANVFFRSGLLKIGNWDGTLYLFENEYKVPLLPAEAAAWLGTFTELVFPPFLALGLATRFAALSLSVFNIIAVISFWHVLSQNQAALNSHWYWGVLLAITLFHGPGKLSLDHWIWKRLVARPSYAPEPLTVR
jgi:putative oxidoreductase